ncbi:MAG: restriction endonuclease [Armatimonadetes bacterium]|nr:restriction endonuclease [Armatimonadota bacterium]
MAKSRKQRESDLKLVEQGAFILAVLIGVAVWRSSGWVAGLVVYCAAAMALAASISAVMTVRRRRLAGSSLSTIDAMSGEQFEEFLKAHFATKGYRAELTRNGSDFGADLILTRNGKRTVVQAKHWRTRDVGVSAIQEVTAAKAHYKADLALVVATVRFTSQAIDLARANNVEVWDRSRLSREIRGTGAGVTLRAWGDPSTPSCPRCGRTMLRRTNQRDGSQFWGCPGFPRCRGTRRL